MPVINEVAIIKVIPKTIKGKYKIGQHMEKSSRTELAKKILERNSPTAIATIQTMGFEIINGQLKLAQEPSW
jgi:predicted FMN-binding regulatory protein PaiB